MSPRVAFSEENKVATGTNFNFPKLKLKKGERARVLAGLEDPVMEYVHTLRAPKVENGEPVFETVTRGTGDNAKQVTVNVLNFISNPICLGDASILADKGSDPDHCPMCQLAKEHPDYTDAPKPRFALHVIRYRTKAGSFDPLTPFSVELIVWAMAGGTFNKISELKKEFNLKTHDLLLGPCEGEMFQKFEISPAANAAWRGDEERKQLVLETFKENQIPDLTIACGTPKKREWVDQDVKLIIEGWDAIKGSKTAAESSAELDEGLNELMERPKKQGAKAQEEWAEDDADTPAESPAAEAADVSDDDLLGDLGSDDAAEEEAPAPKAAAKKPATEKVADFDDLLGDLGDDE